VKLWSVCNKTVKVCTMKDVNYYFDIIDGNVNDNLLEDIDIDFDGNFYASENYRLSAKKSAILEYAFDQLEEIADSSCVEKLLTYTSGSIHDYSSKKFLALRALGYICDKRSEDKVIKYMDSSNPDLSFISYCSVCNMAKRNALSKQSFSIIIDYIQNMIINGEKSSEKVFEGICVLKKINHKNYSEIKKIAIRNYPRIKSQLEEIDIWEP